MEIIYEDNHIVVVIKPFNMPVQEDESKDQDLLSEIKAYIKEKYNKSGQAFIGLVHRLDRPTGGVMVFARNSKAAARLSKQFESHEVEKTYYAVVKGKLRKKKARLENYLKKEPSLNKVVLAAMAEKEAKHAVLDYEVIAEEKDLSLVKVNLETGRSHQIRVQLAGIGNPVYGDAKYGNPESKTAKTQNLALWAGELSFRHPTQDMVLTFKVNPPEDKYPFNLFKFE